MNNFLTRSLTALVFASICIGSIYVEGVMLWVFLFFTMVASHEFHGIYNSNRNKSVQILGVLFNAIVFLMVALILSEKIPVGLLWLLPVFLFCFALRSYIAKVQINLRQLHN